MRNRSTKAEPIAAGTTRRDLIKLVGGALLLTSCADTRTEGDTTDAGTCGAAPTEGAGPYVDKVGGSLFDRSDIAEGRPGVPLVLTLSVVDVANGCAALAGAQVVIWQCDAAGHYSEYAEQIDGYDGTGETFLRGRQTTDARGQVTFRTIYPGWYSGRAAHLHVEVRIDGVTRAETQLALPEAASAAVYTTGAYAAKGPSPLANANDLVFFDSLAHQLVNVTGDPTRGYAGTFTLGVTG